MKVGLFKDGKQTLRFIRTRRGTRYHIARAYPYSYCGWGAGAPPIEAVPIEVVCKRCQTQAAMDGIETRPV